MSNIRVTFANPRTTVRAYLASQMSTEVGTVYPTAKPENGYVQVAWDGTPQTDYPVTIRATIRVTCWHINPTPAESLALVVLGILGGFAGDSSLWQAKHLTGPLSDVDSDTGYHFASLTFRVSPRPSAVA